MTHLNVTTVMSFLMRASYTALRASFTTYPKELSTTQLHLESHRYRDTFVNKYTCFSEYFWISDHLERYGVWLFQTLRLNSSVGRKQTAIPLTIITVLSCGCSTCHFQITKFCHVPKHYTKHRYMDECLRSKLSLYKLPILRSQVHVLCRRTVWVSHLQ